MKCENVCVIYVKERTVPLRAPNERPYKFTLKYAKRKGTHFRVPFSGADDGNRTHTISLEG